MKVSVITVTFNRKDSILNAILSVKNQTYKNIEHIIIDGFSSDGSQKVIQDNKIENTLFLSEPDMGPYDALNKAYKLATGNIICHLHSDDIFHNKTIIKNIVDIHRKIDFDILYGDLVYVSKNNPKKIIRYWRAGNFLKTRLLFGWMMPHTTLFFKKDLIRKVGKYNLNYLISSDYDWELRCLNLKNIKVFYFNKCLINMSVGGQSNKIANSFQKIREDYTIIKKYSPLPSITIFLKVIRKVPQFFLKK